MTDDRTERADAICQHVAAEISGMAPPGLGRWDATWRIVEDASAEFIAALVQWEHGTAGDEQRDRQRLHAASRSLLDAWGMAARAYVASGHPKAEVDRAS